MTETATANNPTDAHASTDAAATLLATASSDAATRQQTQIVQPEPVPTAQTPTTETTTTEAPVVPIVPEKYTFTAPEGTEYDPAVLTSYEGAAREAGLTQDAAQKLIEKMAPALVARQADQVQAIHKEWLDSSTADKEFGGEKLTENLAIAKRAIDTFDPTTIGADGKPVMTPLRTLLEQTGLGSHPEVLRFMYRAGKAISEDKFVGGSAPGRAAVNPAAILYDKPVQKG